MAATKKVTTKPVVKATEAAVKTTVPKAEEMKTEGKTVENNVDAKPVEKKAEVKPEEKKAEGKPVEKKAEGKSEEKKAEVKPAAKKAAEKKPAAKKGPAKKAELKSSVHVQFAGKSYSQEDLMKMAKDVWKYDLKQKAGDLTSVDLYVKPEENIVYYVMNSEFTGSFYI